MGGSKNRKDSTKERRRRFRHQWARALQEQSQSLLQYARRLTNGDEARAQDLVQGVFERILRYCPKPGPIKSIPHYLHGTLHNVWASSKPRAEQVTLDDVIQQVAHPPALVVEPKTEKNLEQNQIAGRVFREMKTEYPELRELLKYRVAGYTLPQIDKALNRDPGFSQWLWRRFVLKVRKEARNPRRWRSDEDQAA